MRRVWVGAVGMVIVAGSVACSSTAESYEQLPQLVDAVAASTDCDETGPGPEGDLVADSATCEGSGVTLYVFDSEAKLEDWRKVGARIGPVVIGPNWAASGDVEELRPIADELSGELVQPND